MFLRPRNLAEALEIKRQHGADASFLAGGTDLVVGMNHGKMPPGVLIDLTGISELSYIRRDGDRFAVGGSTTFADLARLPARALADAARSIGGPQIRNRATIAGNLATASPAGDGSTALLALSASVELRNASGVRRLPLHEFFLDYRTTALQANEIITEITFPANWNSAWYKLGKRGAVNISVVCCAAGVSPEGIVNVAFGSSGPFPLLASSAGRLLSQCAVHEGRITEAQLDEACRIAQEEVRPIDDFRASGDYRRAMAGVLLRKVVRQITSQVVATETKG